MLDKFTKKAQRVIYFSHREAVDLGSPSFESEHLLLGLLREDKKLNGRLNATLEQIRKDIVERKPLGEKRPPEQDMPFSEECARIIKCAADESDRLSLHDINAEHLLFGLLKEDKSFAVEILRRHGFYPD